MEHLVGAARRLERGGRGRNTPDARVRRDEAPAKAAPPHDAANKGKARQAGGGGKVESAKAAPKGEASAGKGGRASGERGGAKVEKAAHGGVTEGKAGAEGGVGRASQRKGAAVHTGKGVDKAAGEAVGKAAGGAVGKAPAVGDMAALNDLAKAAEATPHPHSTLHTTH